MIDGTGTWLFDLPMNMDYVYTNEFGEQVLSNDPKKGIPTKGKYRFKFKIPLLNSRMFFLEEFACIISIIFE